MGKVDAIARFIGLDSLYYLSLKGMVDATRTNSQGYCLACYSGDYPLPMPAELNKFCLEEQLYCR
jgi:amidophosphoribosyltransferase